jgi:zinc transport system substrate-binding protein
VYPLAFVVEQVSGAEVFQVTPTGVEPHDFEVSPQDVVSLRGVDLLFFNGGGLDSWVNRISGSLADGRVQLIDMVALLQSRGASLREDQHEEEVDHEESVIDPHVWLDPQLVEEEAFLVAEILSVSDHMRAETYQQRAESLALKLQDLDREYRVGLSSCKLKTIVVSHDAFGYLADRYGFTVIAIAGLSSQQQPSARRIGQLADVVREQGIKYVFFETLVNPKISETLANEVGAQTLLLNPIEGLTASDLEAQKDYFSLMRDNLANLRLAMDCA